MKSKKTRFFNKLYTIGLTYMLSVNALYAETYRNKKYFIVKAPERSDFIELPISFDTVSVYSSKEGEDFSQDHNIVELLSEELEAVFNMTWFKPLLSDKSLSFYFMESRHFGGFYNPDIRDPSGRSVIFFSKSEFLYANSANRKTMIAHELSHFVQHQVRPHEELWLEEGTALLAGHLASGFFNSAFFHAFDNPEVSLTEILPVEAWNPDNKNQLLSQYGQLYQYFYYLYRLCGEERFLKELLTSSFKAKGVAFLDEILPKTGKGVEVCQGFEVSFKAFQRARFFPQVLPDSAYLFEGYEKARYLKQPLKLPPYSAQVYPSNEGACASASHRKVEKVGFFCLDIRLK